MTERRRDRVVTLGFAFLALALAFWQRPGLATSDTKITLHVAPWKFLADVASVWTPSTDLGEVHSAQYSGYLWPMGPFFAFLHGIGLGPWVVERLWLALMLFLAGWGMLRLLDILLGRPRGIAHVVATLFFVINPYTTVFTARTTITLLGYAALPWLLITVWHGVRTHRGLKAWWWPAAFALMFMSTGGGVNAAVLGWMAVGPAVLLLYEPIAGHVPWRATGAFLLRAAGLSVLASAWWISALLVHVHYGIDFLQYTEQPATIWATNSVSESFRLMGYWTSYIGLGYPRAHFTYFSDSATLIFNVPVLLASLALPALAAVSYVTARRWRYGPFFALLTVTGVTIMSAGFPEGTPLRRGMDWLYYHVFVVRFMRTTNKAAPLLALGLAALLGLGARAVYLRLSARPPGTRRTAGLVLAPVALAALLVLPSLPLFTGKAIDSQLTWKRIPSAWKQAGHDLDRSLPQNSRAIVLPGQIFAYYRWGGTIDALLPRLTSKPVAVRYETPYSDLHADDLLISIDTLVQQNRLVPGQLRQLLGLIGVRAVVSATDDDTVRSGAVAPAVAADALARQHLGPARAFGPVGSVPPAPGDLGTARRLPEVRRYDLPAGRGLVHVDPLDPATVVDGSADALGQLAAFGALPAHAPLFYAGDLTAPAIVAAASRGGNIVVSDTNRRRVFLPQFTQQNVGPALPVDQSVSRANALIDPFQKRGPDAQTVAVIRGARSISAPAAPGFNAFPEHRPIAAFDGDPRTSWIADASVRPPSRYLEVTFDHPRVVPYVDVLPQNGPRIRVTRVDVNGHEVPVGRGVTRIPVGGAPVQTVRIRLAHVDQPKNGRGGPGGFREVRIPGLHVRELLRPPILTAKALGRVSSGHAGLTYLFSRTTGDDLFRRDRYTGNPLLGEVRDRQDAEQQIDRLVATPASRAYALDAWVAPDIAAPDTALDRLEGVRSPVRATSSSRFHNAAPFRASRAFDADPSTAWVGLWVRPEAPLPWIAWRTPQARSLSRLHIAPATLAVRRPTRVRVSTASGTSPVLPVAPDGTVTLPRPLRGRAFRLTIVSSAFPAGTTARERQVRAVGIGSLTVPGLPAISIPRSGPLRTPCGTVRVDAAGRPVPLRVFGTVRDLEAGTPLRARSCGGPVSVTRGLREIRTLPGTLSVDLLRMTSRPPNPVAVAAATGGTVTKPGHVGHASLDGAEVALRGRSWLVLGESFDIGWQATCDGRSLGAPQVIDGYANGWRAPADCRKVAFTFAPQNGVDKSYVLSGSVVLVLILLLLFGPRPTAVPAPREMPGDRPRRGRSLRVAIPAGILIAIPFGLIFALRYTPVIAIGLALVFWRGVRPRTLALSAAAILGILVPAIYLIVSPPNRNGFNFEYSVRLIDAHWAAVAAVLLLGTAACLSVLEMWRAGRRRRGSRPGEPASAPSSASSRRS